LQLITDNLRVNGGDVIHGPYLISQNPVTLNTGDQLSFSWRGEVTDNAFDAYAYLLDADTGSTTELLDSTGNSTTGWSTVTHTVAADASYYFVFVAGSFDYDFTGTVTAASASGNSPVDGAIAASATGTAASGINTVSISGVATGNSVFTNVGQSRTSGNGSGASFTISTDSLGNYTLNSVSSSGNGYEIGDTLTIAGSSLGGVDGVNDLTMIVTTLTPASYRVSQSATTGSGSGAVFTIASNSAGNYSVSAISTFGSNYALNDQVTIAGSTVGGADAQNDATLTLTSVGATSISSVTQASTSGSGSGASFTISIDGAGNYQVNSISSGGSGYEPGDTITLSGASLGGTTPSHNLTLNVDNIEAVSGAILHIDNISVTRAEEAPTIIAGIDISTQSAASDAADVINDAIKQIKFRDAYLASKEIALQNSINAISTQTTSSDLLITDLSVQESLRQLKKIDVVNALMSDVHKARYLASSGVLQLI